MIRPTINSDDKDKPTTWKQSYLVIYYVSVFLYFYFWYFIGWGQTVSGSVTKFRIISGAARLQLSALGQSSVLPLLSTAAARLFTNFMVPLPKTHICGLQQLKYMRWPHVQYLPHVLFVWGFWKRFFSRTFEHPKPMLFLTVTPHLRLVEQKVSFYPSEASRFFSMDS